MPRLRQLADTYAKKDFVAELDAQSARYGLKTNMEIGKVLQVSGPTVGNYREDPSKIKLETMQLAVKNLKLDMGVVLRYLGYTSQDIKQFVKENS